MSLSSPQFSDSTLPLAVVVGATRWDEPPRMRHQVTRQLLRWFNVLFVEFFPCTQTDDEVRTADDRLLVYAPQVGPVPPVRWYANNPLAHARANRRYAGRIEDLAATLPGEPKVLVNFAYDFPEIMGSRLFQHRSYICNDEFPRMWRSARRPPLAKFLFQSRLWQHYENAVARHADLCLASHAPLRDKLRRVNPNTTLFLHGHEFAASVGPTPPRPTDPRVRVAYMGFVTYNLLLDWLRFALDQPDMDLFLIGPIGKFEIREFSSRANFHHVRPLAGAALREVMAGMDVLVMPYNPAIPEVQVQTVSNKFFQYVAAGRPVVISDMPHYIEMPPGVIYRAKTAEDFVAQVRRAHAEDCDAYRELRAQIARENTWDRRGEQLLATIRQDMGSRLPQVCPVATQS